MPDSTYGRVLSASIGETRNNERYAIRSTSLYTAHNVIIIIVFVHAHLHGDNTKNWRLHVCLVFLKVFCELSLILVYLHTRGEIIMSVTARTAMEFRKT